MVLETAIIILIVNTCAIFGLGVISLLKSISKSSCMGFECIGSSGPSLNIDVDSDGQIEGINMDILDGK